MCVCVCGSVTVPETKATPTDSTVQHVEHMEGRAEGQRGCRSLSVSLNRQNLHVALSGSPGVEWARAVVFTMLWVWLPGEQACTHHRCLKLQLWPQETSCPLTNNIRFPFPLSADLSRWQYLYHLYIDLNLSYMRSSQRFRSKPTPTT